MSGDCWAHLAGLLVLLLALLMSLSINAIFLVKQRAAVLRILSEALCDRWFARGREDGSPSQNEGHYFHDPNHGEQQENPNNHCELQENPIYGNISTERGDSTVTYEMMRIQNTREHMKSSEADLNYASLDLKLAKKRKKNPRKYERQGAGTNNSHDAVPQLPSSFLEVEADMDAHLPPREASPMLSHSSIYLNSQQIAQVTEGNDMGASVDREGERQWEEGGGRKWDYGERTSGCNGSVCSQFEVGEDVQSHQF